MAWKLFLDDERDPVGNRWTVCRSVGEAVAVCQVFKLPAYISFDHDLGPGPSPGGFENTGMGFAKWMIEQVLDDTMQLPTGFDYYVHSQNPVGADNIRNIMQRFTNRNG